MGTQVSKIIRPTTTKMANSAEIQQFIKETIAKDKVVVFSKTYCPYCNMAKEVFNQVKQPFQVIELDQRDDGADIQGNLASITGFRTAEKSVGNISQRSSRENERVSIIRSKIIGLENYLNKKVPQVFINGNCVGGGSDVKALLDSGKLESMLIG